MGTNIPPLEEKAPAADEKFLVNNNFSIVPAHEDDYGSCGNDSSENPAFNRDWADNDDDDDDDGKTSSNESPNTADRILYWESQQSFLQEILEHHNSAGTKLRQEIRGIIEMARETNFCRCPNPKSDGGNCYRCLRQRVVNFLCTKGFNSTLCTSHWSHTRKFPGGRHEFIEVIATTQSRKKQVIFLIELEFRDQFKMAKACEDYNKLVSQLPDIFIGKAEHLNAIVGVVCDAAKKSTEEKRIHMGPWRKRGFMQKKWSVSSRILTQFSTSSSSSSSSSSGELAMASSIMQVDMPTVSSYFRFPAAAAAAAAVKVA